ncbi:hypothetical protein [Streptomyces sp. SYP-A7185]|uniref:hypothetical protein n=1 Tax=Streptomyces sp. SYP-A7185 TaxID=3040076 RepID=UPI0038F62FCA
MEESTPHVHPKGPGLCGHARLPNASALRIVVADHHEVVRAGYAGLLATRPDFTVVGRAADGARAVELRRELRST